MADDALGHALRSGPGGAPKHLQGSDEGTEQMSAAALLQEALFKASVRIIDLFREWDSDGRGTISRDAFQRAMAELEYRAPVEEIDALFLKWRSDRTGVLEINELERLLRRGASVMKSAIEMDCDNRSALRTGGVDKEGSTLLQGFAIDEASDLSVAEQLRDALSKAAVRVIDLFREWDDDDSGTVSKEEFRRGMTQMGLKAATEEVDKVFDAFDPDRSGSVELKEFSRLLRRGSSAKLDESLQAGAMGVIETKSDTKFALRKGKKPEQAATLCEVKAAILSDSGCDTITSRLCRYVM
jgi:Ca2+-binding EF-hand superfamily protein